MKNYLLTGLLLLVTWHSSIAAVSAEQPKPLQIAFMPDVHFHDIYAEFSDASFQGLPNTVSGKNATIRSLSAELNSTRLFNENYFAILAALDDIAARGIKLVALPGDFSDDGQPVHLRGLAKILKHYEQQYGMQFFATPGNHDPVRPLDYPGGKSDFLGVNGQEQGIYSAGTTQCQTQKAKTKPGNNSQNHPIICTEEIRHLGYQGMMALLADKGFYPQKQYRYWATPYSNYSPDNYSFNVARQQATFSQRHYEICTQGIGGPAKPAEYSNCSQVADASYVVEPIEGLWLLAIDANVYIPKSNSSYSADKHQNVEFSGSGNAGYNKVLTHKSQLLDWIQQVVNQANERGKKLVAFSHFPMSEFYDGQSDAIGDYFGLSNFQLARRPQPNVSQVLAATGLKVHVGGHMHINDTGFTQAANGQFLLNIQAPSIAAYVPAYKILSLQADNLEVQTIVLNEVPRFNELFEHYQQEHAALEKSGSTLLWDKNILKAKTYREFTNWHIRELTRQRFLPQEWPQDVRDILFNLSGRDMLIMSQMSSKVSLLQISQRAFLSELQHKAQWENATQKALLLVTKAGLTLDSFATWNGFDLAVDVYRLRNAGQLALDDIHTDRLAQYHLFSEVLLNVRAAKSEKQQNIDMIFAQRFGPVFDLLEHFRQGLPDKQFSINMQTGVITLL